MVWNALDYPALIIPTGSYVDESVDFKKPPHQFYNDLDKENYELCELFFFFHRHIRHVFFFFFDRMIIMMKRCFR